MNKIIFLCLFISICDATDFHLSGSGGHSGGGGGNSGPINAAVNSRYSVEVVNVPVQSQPIIPQTIVVGAGNVPLAIQFNSASSRLMVTQTHQGAKGGEERTTSQDEPFNLVHEVKRPIYQEVNEIIFPFRRINQEVRPVQENIQTVVAQQSGMRAGGVGGAGGAGETGGHHGR